MLLELPAGRIAGNLLVLPPTVHTFEEDAARFDVPLERSMKLKSIMGYGTRRTAAAELCISDLIVQGFEHLRETGLLDPMSLDAMILVTQTPDHFVPFTSAIVHGRVGMKQDMLLLDISQGCAGFVIAATEALSWLRQPAIHRVAVVTADVLARKVSPRDRNSLPLVGDGAAITLFEKAGSGEIWPAHIRFDGSRSGALTIPAGGFRLPSSAETAELKPVGEGNWRSADHLCMDGTAVFNFVMTEVPQLIRELFDTAGVALNDIDWFLTHQPNKFMLNKLADTLGVPREKVPDWIVGKYGNSNSVTIPAVMAEALPATTATPQSVCFAGFGVGLTWAALLAKVGPLDFNRIHEYRHNMAVAAS